VTAGSVTFAQGQRLGNYELLLEIASGGAATVGIAVYRGAAGFERLVVVKRVHRALTKDSEFTAMLLDEARLASSIRHPNVVPVIDVVRLDDEVVLVMDYVDSVPLSQLAREAADAGRRLPPPVVSRILVDTLVGLHEAHEAVDIRRQPLGIVHRDVSPQNVIVGSDGVARVIDFGIAKARSRVARTRAGIIKGKCAYMAPEQVDGQPVDRRCDVFAAGIVLWEALTGTRLFKGDDEFDEMRRVMTARIPPPSSVVGPGVVGADVDALLSHALARATSERFQTASAFARALEHAIPPAPARAVGQLVDALCGRELDYRHRRLAAILGDEIEKLSPRTPREGGSSHGGGARTLRSADGAESAAPTPALRGAAGAPASTAQPATPPPPGATIRMAPQVGPRAAAPGAPNLPMSTLKSADAAPPAASPAAHEPMTASVEGIESDVPVVPKRSIAPVLLAVTAASLALGAAGAFVWVSARGAPPAPAPSAQPSSAPVVTAPASVPPPSSAPSAAPSQLATPPPSGSAAASPGPTSRPTPGPRRELKSNPYGQ
jgi:hypothetical protein